MDIAAPNSPAPTPVIANAVTAAVSDQDRSLAAYPEDQPAEQPNEPPSGDQSGSDQQADKSPAETGDYQLQAPEGVTIDQDLLTAAVPVLREANIDPDQANKILPLVTQIQERTLERLDREMSEHRSTTLKSWKEAIKSDPDLGGNNLKETIRLSAVALDAAGAGSGQHDFRQLLNESGLGDNPTFMRAFRDLGRTIEQLRSEKGSPMKRESQIERLQRQHQESVYPDDKPSNRSFKFRKTGSPDERNYMNDQPKDGA